MTTVSGYGKLRHAKGTAKKRGSSALHRAKGKATKTKVTNKTRYKMPNKAVTRKGRPTGLSPGRERKYKRTSSGKFAGAVHSR